jgi:ligand-binding SRPBCC domain-containing protein
MEHQLHTTLELPLPLETVFAFFAEAGNLERITPPELRFEIVAPLPIEMMRGALLEYRLGLFGIPFRWRTEIAAWDPPRGFIDVQLSGPYAVWEHTHVFIPTEAGTLIDDRVRYRLPLSPLGDIAYPLVRRQLARIFAFRQDAVREALLCASTG